MITLFLPHGQIESMVDLGFDIGKVYPVNSARLRLVTTQEKARKIREYAESCLTMDDGETFAERSRAKGLAKNCLNALARQGY